MVPGRSAVSVKREAEISQLRAIAAGRVDAVEWSPTERGDLWTGFPALGVAILHCTWEGTPERRVEYGGMVTHASRGVRVGREADSYAALAALARLALDMVGAAARPSGRPALHIVPADAPRVAAGAAHDDRAPLRPAG
jgi:hypothetical protein